MTSEDHFHLTLPSSASMDLHPANKISDYTIQLLNPITFDREMYEAGLSEIILDASVENILESPSAFIIFRSVEYVKNVLKIKANTNIIEHDEKEYFYEKYFISRGLYKSVTDVFITLNKKFETSLLCKDLVFLANKTVNEDNVLITLKSQTHVNLKDRSLFIFQSSAGFRKCNYSHTDSILRNNDIKPSLKDLICYIPTMDEYVSKNDTESLLHFVCMPSKMFQDPGTAYVYTDIIDHQYVGNTKASLLRIVHFPKGNRVISFPNVHYLPLSKTQLSSIRIYIRDVEGNPYLFTTGTAVCKVHIRRKLR